MNPFKSKILKLVDIYPLKGNDVVPGIVVREVKDRKPFGPNLRVIQVSGHDVLVNYFEEKVSVG